MMRIWLLALGVLVAVMLAGCDTDPAERLEAGNAHFQAGDYRDALGAYQAAQVAAPDWPEPYFNAGSALARLGEYEQAAATLNRAIAVGDPALAAKAYYNLGNVYFESGDYSAAARAYQGALLLNPEDHDARYNLELALRRISPPTPTPADEQPEPTAGETPTDAPGPAPTTETTTPTGAAPTPSPQPLAGTLAPEEAEQLLDAAQRSQRTLREVLQRLTPQAEPLEKDW